MTVVAAAHLPHALLDPVAFPHQPDAVELRETSRAWVFLAGDKAYKVFKPDSGTLKRRRELCRETVALNRRFAPTLYRGVVALVPPDQTAHRGVVALVPNGARGGLRIAPEHDPAAVEYALVMGRYDEDATLAARLRRHRLTRADAAAAGAALARVHAAAPVAAAPPPRVPDAPEDLARFARAALRRFAPQLDARARRGLVRDGHGDLRAEHVLLGDPIQAVDAGRDRVADVGYDLALLVMDVARTDDDLARALVRGYRAAGGDPGPEDLLACFCALRALECANGADPVRAHALLELAERFAWRVRLPRLVCVAGHAASGKSTVAEALARAAGRPVISSDRVRKLRAGVDPYEYAGPSAYGDIASRAVYAELAQRAAAAVREEGGAIVEATFRRAADADTFTSLSPTAAWIVCDAPPEVLLERARARAYGESVADAGPNIVANELAVHRGRIVPPVPPLARLDTTVPVPVLLAGLAETLDARLRGD
ncbi:MAG TPA: AAA family ATPase [Solirubrobacter sp.]|nr:AAA family ATPase [Solirubrobacter sp.]